MQRFGFLFFSIQQICISSALQWPMICCVLNKALEQKNINKNGSYYQVNCCFSRYCLVNVSRRHGFWFLLKHQSTVHNSSMIKMRIKMKSFILFFSFNFFQFFVLGCCFFPKENTEHTRTKSINIQLIFFLYCWSFCLEGEIHMISYFVFFFVCLSGQPCIYLFNWFRFILFGFFFSLRVNPFEMNHILFVLVFVYFFFQDFYARTWNKVILIFLFHLNILFFEIRSFFGSHEGRERNAQ